VDRSLPSNSVGPTSHTLTVALKISPLLVESVESDVSVEFIEICHSNEVCVVVVAAVVVLVAVAVVNMTGGC